MDVANLNPMVAPMVAPNSGGNLGGGCVQNIFLD